MSLSYHFKKAFSSVFSIDGGLRPFVLGAALALGGGYMGAETVLKEASEERTAPYGDAQAAALDKAYRALLADKAQAQSVMGKAALLQQENLASPTEERTRAISEMQSQQAAAERTFDQKKKAFLQTLLISEGIAETDARRLASGYKENIGADYSSPYVMRHSFNHAFNYLDECQQSKSGGSFTSDGYASAVDSCLNRSSEGREIAATFLTLLGGAGGVVSMFMLGGLAGTFRSSVEAEEARRRRERAQKERDAARGVTSEEVNLKVTIEKPKI